MIYATGDKSSLIYILCLGLALVALGAFSWYKKRH